MNNKYSNNLIHNNKREYSSYDDRYSDNCSYNGDKYENCSLNQSSISENCSCNEKKQNNSYCKSVERCCCCKKSMIEALKLLCNTELAEIIDFEKFAFISDTFIVGAKLALLKIGSEDKDNLSNLDGSFKRFSPCNCDLIEIGGTAAYNVPLPVNITDLTEQVIQLIQNVLNILGEQVGILGTIIEVLKEIIKILSSGDLGEQILQAVIDFAINYLNTLPVVNTASLCNLDAIAFQVKYVDSNSTTDETKDEITERNYQKAKYILINKLDKTCFESTSSPCYKNCSEDSCCCEDSILNELFNSNLSHRATLTAGNLTLREANVLGVKGDVLVIANDKKRRFYFVCAQAVQFLE